MKKLMMAALLCTSTTSVFAQITFKIGEEQIVPKFETQQSLIVKLGQPTSHQGNKMVWKKGRAMITAEFSNGKLQEIYSNVFYVEKTGDIEQSAEFLFAPYAGYGRVNSGAYNNIPILKVGNGIGRNFCLASRWINKSQETIRYTVKVKGVDDGSFYWSADTTKAATDAWNLYRKDSATQGMGKVSRVGWINEAVNYDVKKCY